MPAITSSSLDADDYNPISHLNAIFSHPSALAAVSPTSQALRSYQDDIDEDIANLVAAQTRSDTDSVRRIQVAKTELADLFKKIDGVRARALETEQSITEMTADIKRLDHTKRNLTLSMTALKRLQMLTTAYEQLEAVTRDRQYKECAQLLQAVLQLVAHFRSYRSIDQIATLSRNVAELQNTLAEQVCLDFENAFTVGQVSQKKSMLAEACLVMDALGDHARIRLINWYCNTQLREYRQVFRGSDEAGSLDNISRRYSWFNRTLKTYDVEHATIFPAHWKVNEMLANSFCEGTREDYKGILQREMRRNDGQALDVNLLLSCLQETLNFEHSLERRFTSEMPRMSIDTTGSKDESALKFNQSISEAFEPYMSLWVESQDKQLAALIPKYRIQPLRSAEEDFSPQAVVPSSTELFHFYRQTLAQCAKLSTGNRLQELSKTFAKYLEQYGQQVLFHHLSEAPGTTGPSLEDIILVLNTADYCNVTCNQLEEKIKGRIDEDLRDKVDLQSQADAFIGIASAAVRALVRKVEIDCEPTWREMRNYPWAKLEHVGDQSTYVAELLRHVRDRTSDILKVVHKPQYARSFCDNLVDLMVTSYINNIVQCRPISEVGAEQMLLDSYVLKKGFIEIPIVNEEPGTTAPAAFVKRVNQTLAKLDPLLKTLQVRPSPPEALVQAYLIHIGDRSETNFRKILDLKGIRKQEQSSLVDLFMAHRAGPSHVNLPDNSPLLTPLQIAAPSSGISSLGAAPLLTAPNLAGGRFDPTTFGSVLMNAARDGVDRFGSPALSIDRSSATSPAPPDGSIGPGALNENLRNIGKFFRREGTFGRFGRGGDDAK